MSHIIAGHFQTQDEIAEARAALQGAGFGAEDISAFYANPQGQHDVHPLGGDHDDSPGAKESSEGVVQGGGAGALERGGSQPAQQVQRLLRPVVVGHCHGDHHAGFAGRDHVFVAVASFFWLARVLRRLD